MPIWLIEIFAAKDLDAAFLWIALMTAPLWIAMIAFPDWPQLRHLAQPWVVVPLFSFVLVLLLLKSYQANALPALFVEANYQSAQSFVRHPITFLVLFCNLQIINLFVGVMIYQKALKSGFRAPFELTLCWFLGALALIPFGLRLLFRRQASV